MTAIEDARVALDEWEEWDLTCPWIEEMQGQIARDIAYKASAALRGDGIGPGVMLETKQNRDRATSIVSSLDSETIDPVSGLCVLVHYRSNRILSWFNAAGSPRCRAKARRGCKC